MSVIHPTIAWLTWRQLVGGRRLLVALALALSPALFALAFRLLAERAAESTGFFVILQREIVIGTLLPLIALVVGTAAFGAEAEDGTLIYSLIKPIRRWRLVTSKYAVTALLTTTLLVPAVVLPWLVLRGDALPRSVVTALIIGISVGAVLYSALFAMLGIVTRRAFALGLLYAVVFENVFARSGAAGARSLSVREFAVSVAQSIGTAGATLGTPSVPMSTVRTVGAAMLIGSLAVAIWRLRRFQLAERL